MPPLPTITANFSVSYKILPTRQINNSVIVTKPSTVITATVLGTVPYSFNKFEVLITKNVTPQKLIKTFDGVFSQDTGVEYTNNAPEYNDFENGNTYTYTVRGYSTVSGSYGEHSVTINDADAKKYICAPYCCPSRFPYGRFNNTKSNFKLFAPLLNTCGYKNPNYTVPHLANHNLYKNTSYQMSKKELYKYLSNNRAYLYR